LGTLSIDRPRGGEAGYAAPAEPWRP